MIIINIFATYFSFWHCTILKLFSYLCLYLSIQLLWVTSPRGNSLGGQRSELWGECHNVEYNAEDRALHGKMKMQKL